MLVGFCSAWVKPTTCGTVVCWCSKRWHSKTQLIKPKPTISEYEFEPTQTPQQVKFSHRSKCSWILFRYYEFSSCFYGRRRWMRCSTCTCCWKKKTCWSVCGRNDQGSRKPQPPWLTNSMSMDSLNSLSNLRNKWVISVFNLFLHCVWKSVRIKLFLSQAMSRARSDHDAGPAPPTVHPEYRLWEEHWVRFVSFILLSPALLKCAVTLRLWVLMFVPDAPRIWIGGIICWSIQTLKGTPILTWSWRVLGGYPTGGLMKEALGQVGEPIFIFSIHPCNLM